MATDLRVLTNTDRAFYPTLGPYLSRREVVTQVGGPVWDDDAKTWLVIVKDKRVLGFVAVATRGGRVVVESLYVIDLQLRRVAAELVAAAVGRFGRHKLHATVTRGQLPAFAPAGFQPVSETLNFTRVQREATP